ncbi:MAG: hypothetical protein WAK29_20825 [Terriglobales bacterium]
MLREIHWTEDLASRDYPRKIKCQQTTDANDQMETLVDRMPI